MCLIFALARNDQKLNIFLSNKRFHFFNTSYFKDYYSNLKKKTRLDAILVESF